MSELHLHTPIMKLHGTQAISLNTVRSTLKARNVVQPNGQQAYKTCVQCKGVYLYFRIYLVGRLWQIVIYSLRATLLYIELTDTFVRWSQFWTLYGSSHSMLRYCRLFYVVREFKGSI